MCLYNASNSFSRHLCLLAAGHLKWLRILLYKQTCLIVGCLFWRLLSVYQGKTCGYIIFIHQIFMFISDSGEPLFHTDQKQCRTTEEDLFMKLLLNSYCTPTLKLWWPNHKVCFCTLCCIWGLPKDIIFFVSDLAMTLTFMISSPLWFPHPCEDGQLLTLTGSTDTHPCSWLFVACPPITQSCECSVCQTNNHYK